MALPDDLKTKLSMDDDLVVASPKEALSRAAERVAMRNKNLRRVSSIQLRDDLLSMLVSGHETTGSVLTWTAYLLSRE
ncbi:unnamed protein product [Camellia sinensis]